MVVRTRLMAGLTELVTGTTDSLSESGDGTVASSASVEEHAELLDAELLDAEEDAELLDAEEDAVDPLTTSDSIISTGHVLSTVWRVTNVDAAWRRMRSRWSWIRLGILSKL